ncbi:MerR family transcriptional regulator [Rhodoferax sp.]|uniref:MerR family transcriptional regulator n=1 Tax=Rhodoferax sp. TaxID=50421 RepID=UPI002629C4B8|nr:MerR family transcriptional regulator [Rhodoferax sp.]MDD2919172.1 MerR family transcriptional regulator [Rhodoferax sp.]
MINVDSPLVPIQQVERETGITKETLRKWESRYGFPQPQRHLNGERLYCAEDLHQLRLIKGLLDAGHRPGKIVALPLDAIKQLYAKHTDNVVPASAMGFVNRVFARLQDGNVHALHRELETALLKQGLNTFVEKTLPPLITCVGKHWESGSLAIHQEHLFSEILRSVLQSAALRLRGNTDGVRVLMATAPDEQHGMGLIMLQTLLTLEGAQCINLGTQVPLVEMVNSAMSYRAEIVAISFSLSYASRNISPFVLNLRRNLPAETALWAGGAGVDRLRSKWPGVTRFEQIGSAAKVIRKSC